MAKGNFRIVSGEVGKPIMAVWDDGTVERAFENALGPNAGTGTPYLIPESLVKQYQGASGLNSADPFASTFGVNASYAPAIYRKSKDSFVDKFAIPAFMGGLGGTALGLSGGAETATSGADIAGGAGSDALVGGAGSDALAAGGEFTGGLQSSYLGSGATPGLSAPGGFSGSTLGAGGASAVPGLAATTGAAGTALAPGYFAAESLYPVLGGTAAAAGATGMGVGTGVSAAAGGTALSNALDGAATTADALRLLGIGAGAGLGMYGAGQQADALREIANQSRADRAPFLSKSLQYLNSPQAFLDGPGKASMDAVLRGLSVKGNPAGMPSSLDLAADASMRNWLNATTSLGNLGLAGEDVRASLGAQAAGADANGLNALGYGIGAATNPQPTIADLLKQIRGSNGLSL